jgi:hypothetical protein
MAAPERRFRQPRQLDARSFQPEISSFRLYLPPRARPPGPSGPTPGAVRWFAAAHLIAETSCTRWGR